MSEPVVTCRSCGRVAECITVSDGTTYKPIAWTYDDPEHPMLGTCNLCQVPSETIAYTGKLSGFRIT